MAHNGLCNLNLYIELLMFNLMVQISRTVGDVEDGGNEFSDTL